MTLAILILLQKNKGTIQGSFVPNNTKTLKMFLEMSQAEKEPTKKDVDRWSFLTVVKAINRFNVQSAYSKNPRIRTYNFGSQPD